MAFSLIQEDKLLLNLSLCVWILLAIHGVCWGGWESVCGGIALEWARVERLAGVTFFLGGGE